MAKLSQIKPGQVLYTIYRGRMGHTTISTVNVHEVQVVEVHDDHVIARWNYNPPRRYGEYEVARWRVKEPITVKGAFGSRRLARRDEIAAMKTPSPE